MFRLNTNGCKLRELNCQDNSTKFNVTEVQSFICSAGIMVYESNVFHFVSVCCSMNGLQWRGTVEKGRWRWSTSLTTSQPVSSTERRWVSVLWGCVVTTLSLFVGLIPDLIMLCYTVVIMFCYTVLNIVPWYWLYNVLWHWPFDVLWHWLYGVLWYWCYKDTDLTVVCNTDLLTVYETDLMVFCDTDLVKTLTLQWSVTLTLWCSVTLTS